MKIRPTSLVVAVLLVLSFATMTFAQTVPFNKSFLCNGERQIVSSCFDDSDSAHCMVMYPDRPLAGGSTVQIVEMRPDVVKKIKSCLGANATLASTGQPGPAPARKTPAAPTAAAKPNAPPPPPDPSVAKAKAAGVDSTVLGVQLGTAYTIQPCQQVGIGDVIGAIFGSNTNTPPQTYPCSTGVVGNGFGTTTDQGITFSANQCPAWISPCTATVMVKNGLLLGAYIFTTGQNGDSAATVQLVAKYGKPTQQTAVTFKNLYNYSATFQKMVWTLPGLYVEYDPFTTDINQGQLYIETETAHQIRISAAQTQQTNGPKL